MSHFHTPEEGVTLNGVLYRFYVNQHWCLKDSNKYVYENELIVIYVNGSFR